MTRNFDVIVAGAGIVGVSTALNLQMRGLKVGLIDRRGPGLETSYGNAGVIGNSYILPFGFPETKKILDVAFDRDTAARVRYSTLPRYLPWLLAFYWESLPKQRARNGRLLWPLLECAVAEHKVLMQNTDAARHMHKTGRVSLFRDERGFEGGLAERKLADELGVAYEVMESAAFREVEPHLTSNFHKVVRWTDSPRLDNPGAVTAAYAERFVRDGGTFLIEDITAVQRLSNATWRVVTSRGEAEAPRVVMCLGPWSNELLSKLRYHFPMAPKRGYNRHYKAKDGATLSHAITDAAWGYVMVPMEAGIRLTSGAEIADLDAPPNPIQLTRLFPHAQELFPFGDPVEPQAWYGTRPCFADSLPVIGQAPRHPGLWFNFGHGHTGLTMGPSSARLLAELMTGAKPFCDPTPYLAERFGI